MILDLDKVMAPEVMSESQYDTKADIYSFALCLFEMVFGLNPLRRISGKNPFTIISANRIASGTIGSTRCAGDLPPTFSRDGPYRGGEELNYTLLVKQSRRPTDSGRSIRYAASYRFVQICAQLNSLRIVGYSAREPESNAVIDAETRALEQPTDRTTRSVSVPPGGMFVLTKESLDLNNAQSGDFQCRTFASGD